MSALAIAIELTGGDQVQQQIEALTAQFGPLYAVIAHARRPRPTYIGKKEQQAAQRATNGEDRPRAVAHSGGSSVQGDVIGAPEPLAEPGLVTRTHSNPPLSARWLCEIILFNPRASAH